MSNDMMPDFCADLLLNAITMPVIFLIAVVGSTVINRSFLIQTGCLLAFGVIVNIALKATFKIPLSSNLHAAGYAFPSGHMQFATVFYGWLALHIHAYWFRILTGLLLAGIGASLVHYGYHDTVDVLGGLLCGGVLVLMYQYSLIKLTNTLPWLLLAIATPLIFYANWVYQTLPHAYAWVAYAFLSTLIVIERIASNNGKRLSCWLK